MENDKSYDVITKEQFDAQVDVSKFLLNMRMSLYEARLNSTFTFYKSLFAIYGAISALLLIVPLNISLTDSQGMLLFYAILSFISSIIIIVIAMQLVQYAINRDIDAVDKEGKKIFEVFSVSERQSTPELEHQEKDEFDWHILSLILNWLSVVLCSSGFIITVMLSYDILCK